MLMVVVGSYGGSILGNGRWCGSECWLLVRVVGNGHDSGCW